MVEIDIYYIILGVTVVVSIVSTLATAYLKKIAESVASIQIQGKLTEIDEKIKHGFAKNQNTETEQRTLLINFHSECISILYDFFEIHKSLWYTKEESDFERWEVQIVKLNKTLSSIKLFFVDQIIIEKASKIHARLNHLYGVRYKSDNEVYFLYHDKRVVEAQIEGYRKVIEITEDPNQIQMLEQQMEGLREELVIRTAKFEKENGLLKEEKAEDKQVLLQEIKKSIREFEEEVRRKFLIVSNS